MPVQPHRSTIKSFITFFFLGLLIASIILFPLMWINGLFLYPLVSISEAFTAIYPIPLYLYSYYAFISIIFTAMYIDRMPHKNFIIASIILSFLAFLIDTWDIGRFSNTLIFSSLLVANLALYGLGFLLLQRINKN